MIGGTGSGGGGGSSGQWPQAADGVLPLPPSQSQAGYPAQVISPCTEVKSGEYLYVSIPLSYPVGWPPEDIDLRAEAREMLSDYEIWEVRRQVLYEMGEGTIKSNYVPSTLPEEVANWRAASPHWISSSEIVSQADISFGEVGGNPRVWWEVRTTSFLCFRRIIPPPPPPPPLPPGTNQTGSGHGTVLASFLYPTIGEHEQWRKKKI